MRGSSYKVLTGKVLVFSRTGRLRGEVTHGGNLTVLKYSFKRWIKRSTGLTRFNSCYSFSYTFNSAASFMSKNNRKLSLRVIAAKSVTVCVTDTSSDNLDAYLTSFGWCHFNCFYRKWFTSLPGYCRTAGYGLQLTRAKGRIDVNNLWCSLQILDLQRLASLDIGLKETNCMVARSMQHNITQICQSPPGYKTKCISIQDPSLIDMNIYSKWVR